jgi:hypothetical protein
LLVKGSHYVEIENITGNVIWSPNANNHVLFHYDPNPINAPGSFRVYLPNQQPSTNKQSSNQNQRIAIPKTQNMLVYYTHILRRLINSTDREENH